MDSRPTAFEDPKERLQREWHARRKKNAALSLRSFARFLRISPGRLSEILSGKRKISLEMAEHLSQRLGFDPATKAAFVSAILQRKRPRVSAPKTDQVDPEYKQLAIDAFHVIADWYHFAILSLRDCESFRPDETWIAKRLAIGTDEVRLALVRLERLGLIERQGASWARTAQNLSTTHDVRSAGLRKGHRGMLERAIDSLEAVDLELRDITNMTMAINPDNLPKAKAMLAQFRRKLAKTLEAGSGRTEVYTLALQLFPLTQPEKKR